MVMEVVHEDIGDGNLQCTHHPYKNISTPGGICPVCLQEKLGNLIVSSSSTTFPLANATLPSSSSSSSPSIRSDIGGSSDSTSNVFKRSKSTKTPRRGMNFSDDNKNYIVEDYSPYKRGYFWSFLLYLSKSSKKNDKHIKDSNFVSASASTVGSISSSVNDSSGAIRSMEKRRDDDFVMVDENDESPFDRRKVSRSRSVGCGSRSFSGDFFEKISSGFGDCTLRKVESQREGKPYKVQSQSVHRKSNGQDCTKERVKCGGIFSGFMFISSSSSSSSAEEINNNNVNGKSISLRSKSWGWAFASPLRAFSNKPSNGKKDDSSNKNVTPNLAAIPSLLAEKQRGGLIIY